MDEINDGNGCMYKGTILDHSDDNIIWMYYNGTLISYVNTSKNPFEVIHYTLPTFYAMKKVLNIEMADYRSDVIDRLCDLIDGQGLIDLNSSDINPKELFGIDNNVFISGIKKCRNIVKDITNWGKTITGRLFEFSSKESILTIWWDDKPSNDDIWNICCGLSREYDININTFLIALPYNVLSLKQFLNDDEGFSDDLDDVEKNHKIHNLPPEEKWRATATFRDVRDHKNADTVRQFGSKYNNPEMTLAQYRNMTQQESKNHGIGIIISESQFNKLFKLSNKR